jgi:phosphate acyltransferase
LARIALDVMGGDHAPQAPVAGALEALIELDPSHRLQLFGDASLIESQLDRLFDGDRSGLAGHRERLEVVDAPEVITMADKPSVAVRGKQKSSMVLGIRSVAEGRSDGFVSAGNTGAQMAASVFLLRLHEGLDRPAIATVFPTSRHPVVVLDSGANVDCSPRELVQFARLGTVYAEDVLGRENPGVGLLSIGEEPEKGNLAVKEANRLLQGAGMNFLGNVEGRDILAGVNAHGEVDVVVCDGFVGNVVLKFYESVAPLIVHTLESAGYDSHELMGALRHLDYSEVGGAPLLGVKGISIICHGSSSPRAIKNALKVAVRAAERGLNDHIGRRLAEGTGAAA